MRRVNRTALVPYSARQMFELVDDVDTYAEFLPWCRRSIVLSRTTEAVDATIELSRGSIQKSFTTRNLRSEFDAIDLELLDGPFSVLEGRWRFEQLGDDGCRVTLSLNFEFRSRVVDLAFGAFFEETCNSLVDAFTHRAADVYVGEEDADG